MTERFTLVGMLDSPFVRRVAVALELYGLDYENLPLATVGDAERFGAYSPLKRAPTLVLPNGEILFDSHLILEHLDELVDEETRLLPRAAEERLRCRRLTGAATGLADKAVSAFYEIAFHPPEARNQKLLARNRGQLTDTLDWLEARAPTREFLFGARPSHADVAFGTALRFTLDVHADFCDVTPFPAALAWLGRLEELPVFQKTYLPFSPPV